MKNIVAIVFSSYPDDPRVRRESEAMTESGLSVDVICARYSYQSKQENVNNINVHRIKNYFRPQNKFSYIWNYIHFMILAFFKLIILSFKKRIHLVHVHNMPDFLIYVGLIHKLFGTKLILDMHDPSPEMFMTKFELSESHKMIRIIKTIEQQCIQLADAVFTPNIAFKNIFISRGADPAKITIIMNSPMENIFNLNVKPTQKDDKFTVMYHGSIVHRYGLDLAIQAVNQLKDKIPEIQFEVYGESEFLPYCTNLAKSLGCENRIHIHGQQSLEVISNAIADVDLGIVPNRISVFTQINFPTRVFEYLSLKKPVIVPATKGILDYFKETDLYFYQNDTADEIANLIWDVYQDREKSRLKTEAAYQVYKKNCWELQKQKMRTKVFELLHLDTE